MLTRLLLFLRVRRRLRGWCGRLRDDDVAFGKRRLSMRAQNDGSGAEKSVACRPHEESPLKIDAPAERMSQAGLIASR
jgi:hypothetical protein